MMTPYLATGIAEGFEEAESEEQVIEAWQFLIDTGLAWSLQGWFGRTAKALIKQGVCKLKDNTECPTCLETKKDGECVNPICVENREYESVSKGGK